MVTLPACETNAPGCIAERLLAPPVVSADGRIRAVIAGGGLGEAPDATFRIVALDRNGVHALTQGACPEGSLAGFGQDASGESLVLCVSTPADPSWRGALTVHAGRLEPSSGGVRWQWRGRLPAGVLGYFVGVRYFALLGSELALIFEGAQAKGKHPPKWNLARVPSNTDVMPLCSNCEVVALLVVDGDLRILTRSGVSYEEVLLTQTQGLLRNRPAMLATLAPTDPRAPCLSQTADGSTSVLLPSPSDSSAPTRSATLLLRYPSAWLPQGPDVYSAERATCPPRQFPDATRPKLPAGLRRWLRATRGNDWQLVYDLPEITEHSWRQALFKNPKLRYDYPGSLRLVHFADAQRDVGTTDGP